MIKVGIVIPTYNVELFQKFCKEWWSDNGGMYDMTWYVVEDNPNKTMDITSDDTKIKHYCWADIDNDLGEDSWIISRRSSAIRSYGYLKAWQDGMDYILTLDDDCYPHDDMTMEELIEYHLEALTIPRNYSSYFHVGDFLFGNNRWMRGSPVRYRKPRKAYVSVGGWSNNPDLDAWTQLQDQAPKEDEPFWGICNVPKYLGLTMCGMNVMFHRDVIPIAYFMLQGEAWGVDRVDDIWAGLFMKKVLDHFDTPMAINGLASVRHERASDALTSLKKEGITLQETELLWDRLSSLNTSGETIIEVYKNLVLGCVPEWFGSEYYGTKLLEAMRVWTKLFQQ